MMEEAILETPAPASDAVAALAADVAALLESDGRRAALRRAMTGSATILRTPSDDLRRELRKRVFTQLSTLDVPYQGNDFECVDYHQYELAPDLPMFRGPPVPAKALAAGDYFCVMGAAQTFGRLVRRPWPRLLSEVLGLPVLNLSRGGVGPEFFLDPRVVDLARRARFVVLQVMSGRSVGCDDYPGGRRITKDGRNTDLQRLDLLETLWRRDRRVAMKYVRRWNETYVGLYERIRRAIDRPTALAWISERAPDAWAPDRLLDGFDHGAFPHLIGEDIHRRVASLFDEGVVHVSGATAEATTSRITGRRCPHFGGGGRALHSKNTYYPSTQSHCAVAAALAPWALDVVHPTGEPA
jgi:hypothetical protein